MTLPSRRERYFQKNIALAYTRVNFGRFDAGSGEGGVEGERRIRRIGRNPNPLRPPFVRTCRNLDGSDMSKKTLLSSTRQLRFESNRIEPVLILCSPKRPKV